MKVLIHDPKEFGRVLFAADLPESPVVGDEISVAYQETYKVTGRKWVMDRERRTFSHLSLTVSQPVT